MMPKRELPSFDLSEEKEEGVKRLKSYVATETIDLDQALSSAVTDSGSFDVGMINIQEFTKLFQAIPIPLFLADKTGTVVFMNDSCAKVSDEYMTFKGRPFTDLFARQAVRKGIRAAMAEVFHTRRVRRARALISVRNRAVWGRIHLRPLRMGYERYLLILVEDLTPERTQLLLTIRHQQSLRNEIAQRTRAEDAIRRSELKYRILFDNAPIGIASVNQDGKILFVNPKACEIVGCTEEDLASKTFISFVHEEDRHLLLQKKDDGELANSNGDGCVCRMTAKDASMKWVEMKSVEIDWNGIPATLKFMQDVTRRRKMEEEFVKIQKLESLGLLAGGIAHDFNNILTAILGNISLGKTSLSQLEQAVSRLSDAERACVRAQGLTQQLLTFSKGGAPIKQASSLDSIIEESCRFAVQGSNVGCDIHIPQALWPAEVDPAQISQVMQNMVINAAQAMPDGGAVVVTAENAKVSRNDGLPVTPGDYVRITVEDHGSGIPEDVLPHIFDPYFTTKSRGSGLGLATAYSIVKSHSGAITVDSVKGRGSIFSVYLPATHRKPLTPPRGNEIPTPGKGKVLVMDDEQAVRDLLKEALSRLGYQVQVARDGEEALALYSSDKDSSDPFDTVILDLTVPGGMGGKETALRIRGQDSKINLIVSSGYSNDPVMANYKEYGINAVVPKPYTLAELSQALSTVNGNGSHAASGRA
ncbi:MAG: PAS domain S-box protein [Thermodesulfobacteriota bacterium]